MRISRRLLALPLCLALLSTAADAGKPKIGKPAPSFELALVNGQKVSLADLRGQVVVINFCATWCGPCRTELPELDAYYKAHKIQGLRVFAITTEGSVPERQLKELFSVMTIEPIRKIRGPYNYIDGAVPTNFVIDRAGQVRYAKAGAFNRQQLNEIVLPLLKEPKPADIS